MHGQVFTLTMVSDTNPTQSQVADVLKKLIQIGLADARETVAAAEGDLESATLAASLSIAMLVPVTDPKARPWNDHNDLGAGSASAIAPSNIVSFPLFVAASWEHIFKHGLKVTRFVFDRSKDKVTFLQVLEGDEWVSASSEQMADVEDSLKNGNPEALDYPRDYGIVGTFELPNWASSSPKAVQPSLPQWQQYRVGVTRTSYRFCSIFVNAFSPKEAERKALERAGDHDFANESNADYEASSVEVEEANIGRDILEGHPKNEILSNLGYEIYVDGENPGAWFWSAPSDMSEAIFTSAADALEGAWNDAVEQAIRILDSTAERWNALSFGDQKSLLKIALSTN